MQICLQVASGQIAEIYAEIFLILIYFFPTNLQVRPLGGSLCAMAQTMQI